MCSTKSMGWLIIPLILGFFVTSIFIQVQIEDPTEVLTVNPNGATGTALVAYHAGLTSFQRDVTLAFARGLASNDWRCELTTVSRDAPTDLSAYDLLVLGTPAYAFKPAGPVMRYLERLGDLGGLPTALIATGGGTTAPTMSALANGVEEANGTTIELLELWQVAPNEEMHGISDAIEIAEQTGASIELP